jgi:hypothetical protein
MHAGTQLAHYEVLSVIGRGGMGEVWKARSPDGRWIAYESGESGPQLQIFVRPFPDVTGRREQVSIDGGRYPLWGPPGERVPVR